MPNKKDRLRFERIMLVHLDAAYNLALWLMRDASEAEDIVQSAYMKAFEHFPDYQECNASGWIMTIVRNMAYNRLKKQKRNSNLVSFDDVLHSVDAESRAVLSPEDIVSAASSGRQLMDAMERLSVEFREALYLRELEGYSYKEIAEITQVPKGTVMSRLSRARGQLQKLLATQIRKDKTGGL